MALGTNGIDVPCSVCDRPDLTPVELARQSLALGGADVDECDVNVLARAVIAQDEELVKLRAALAEALECVDDQPWRRQNHSRAAFVARLRRLVDGE